MGSGISLQGSDMVFTSSDYHKVNIWPSSFLHWYIPQTIAVPYNSYSVCSGFVWSDVTSSQVTRTLNCHKVVYCTCSGCIAALLPLKWYVSQIIIKWATHCGGPLVPTGCAAIAGAEVFATESMTRLCMVWVGGWVLDSLPGNGKIMWKQVSTTERCLYSTLTKLTLDNK